MQNTYYGIGFGKKANCIWGCYGAKVLLMKDKKSEIKSKIFSTP